MELNLTTLQKRIVSAFVLIPLTLGVIWCGGVLFALFIMLCAALSLYEWASLSLKTKYKYQFLISGLIYILLSFYCCYLIRIDLGIEVSFVFICMIWASDIGAYILGKSIGGPKMAVSISPNKTWVGLLGAVIGPLIILGLYRIIFATESYEIQSLITIFVLSLALGLSCQGGDLLVSFLKRKAGQKDSGALIPGHGGLLDRIDSLMLAAPIFFVLIHIYVGMFMGTKIIEGF